MSNRSKVKKNAVQKIASENERFREFADHVVNPNHARPILAPSLCPSRAGAVTFPLVVDVVGMSDFCVLVQPDIHAPLMISHPSAITETNEAYHGSLTKELGGPEALLTMEGGCDIESIKFKSKNAMPLFSTAGCLLTVGVALTDGDAASYTASVDTWNELTQTWTFRGSAQVQVGFGSVVIASLFSYTSSDTAFGISVVPNTGTLQGAAHGNFDVLIGGGGGIATCSNGTQQNVFDIYEPEWSKILEVADKVSIPFMDCLVTYQGSTLNNQGAIAVAGTSEEILPPGGDYYAAVASRPFDSYEGRLSSQGETEGGGHWHLMHDDIKAYSLAGSEELITGPRGYFAIKGMDPTQPVRVMVHITLNYYTIDPAFTMGFQPPWGELDLLLYILRTQVPLCSSNDGHFDKMIRLAKRKASEAGRWALQNPEEAVALAMKGAGMIALM